MDQFSVDLQKLEHAGNTLLPAVSDTFGTCAKNVQEATGWLTSTFTTYGHSQGESSYDTRMNPSFHLFNIAGNECYTAMDLLRRVFEDNQRNVESAAQAITEIARRYREVDGQE